MDRRIDALSPAVLAGLGVECAVHDQIGRLSGARATAYLPGQIRRDARRQLSAHGVRKIELRLVGGCVSA